jgi:hypothetical protein
MPPWLLAAQLAMFYSTSFVDPWNAFVHTGGRINLNIRVLEPTSIFACEPNT